VTVLTPHAADVRGSWREEGVEAFSFRYAPEGSEVLGYGRSLDKDEVIRWRAGAVAPLYSLAARRALRRLAKRRGFDLVHGHWIVPNGLIVSSAALQIPTAVGLHGSDVFLAERPGVRRLVRWALSRTRLLTGCSPELVDRVCRLGFASDNSRVIPYGVDTEQFSPDVARREAWRQKLGIPSAAVVGLGVGRMVTKKGFHVLLEVLPELLEQLPELHLILGGDGDRLGEFRRAMEPWAARVHFPGVVYRDSLPDLYRAADFFVLPAVHDAQGNVDGLPNVILEAMASGLPVLASGISGIPLAVRHETEGLLVGEEDRPALQEALQRIASDEDLRRQLGAAARRRATSELTWKAVASRYREAYAHALDGFEIATRA
jgi:glycosyltransferase involved in cell wall biosynthesis